MRAQRPALLTMALAALLAWQWRPAGADVLTDSYVLVHEGNADNATVGWSVATAGDVNGDGYGDILLTGSQGSGPVWCYYGNSGPGGLPEFTTPDWLITGFPPTLLNCRVSPAGDVNGDGYGDVLIGAPLYSMGEFGEGAVFVFPGSSSGLSGLAQATTIESDVAGAALGAYIDTAGDVNGDGYDDIVVGSPNYSNGESFEGRALVYLGSAGGIQTTPVWSYESNVAQAYFGMRVAGTGDVNGDGYDDILVSAPELANGENGEGRVYLFFGSESGPVTSPSWTYESNIVGGRAGWGLGCAGDVDGDGYSDVVFDVGTNNPAVGSVRVFFGGPTVPGTTPNRMFVSGHGAFGDMVYTAGDINGDGLSDLIAGDVSEINGGKITILGGVKVGNGTLFPVLAERYGVQAGEQFGADCRSAGDVNGDGFGDVIVGAPRYDNGNTDEGSVRLYLGRASVPNFSAAWNPTGSSGSWLGASVAQGDWNGDGYTDIAVGHPNYASGGMTPGGVGVYYGAYWGYTTSSNWFVAGTHDDAVFGYAVANAGDIDNDGCEELIVGEPNYGTFDYPQIGAVHIFKGSPGGLGTTPWWYQAGGIQPGAFGHAVSGAGDVNGDGYADVVVGAPFYEFPPFERGGATYLYLGSATGLATNAVWVGFGGATGDLFGYSVAGVGDMTGDGFGDIAVGAPYKETSSGLANEGFFYVFYGAATGINGAAGPFSSGQAGAQYGYRVAAGGDLNGDGYSDLLMGAPFWDEDGQVDRGFVWALGGTPDLGALLHLWSRIGTNGGDRMGWAVAGGGDLNGDGYSDVAVGATKDDFGSPDGGAVYIHFGTAYGVDPTTAAVNWGTDSQGQFGYALSMAGDATGDGFADILVGQPTYHSSDFGRAYCFYGAREAMPAHEDGTMRNPRQLKTDFTTLIQVGGASDSPFEFHFLTYGRSARGRATLDFQYQIAERGEAWTGSPISAGSYDTGQPSGGGSFVGFNLAATNLVPNTPYRWRTRFVGDSPYFPLSQWFYLAGNGPGEPDLRTGAGPTGVVASGSAGTDGLRTMFSRVGPNPCRDEATISFSLPTSGAARLTVHDVTGRRVATLIDGELEAGAQSASWDTRDHSGRPVGAGLYLLRLEHGSDKSAAKLIVQR